MNAHEMNRQTTKTEEESPTLNIRMSTERLSVHYGPAAGVKDISLSIYDKSTTALIGPSGCGKTTFLRALNRLHDLTPEARVTGRALLDGEDIYASGVDPVTVRRRIGMVFQKPTTFPTKSIYDNVAAGLRLTGIRKRAILEPVVEQSLQRAALWGEVKDRLKTPANSLSGGQQQRLCIARALAVDPEILLMDEPTSSLDPKSAASIEELVQQLSESLTTIIVTHNMQQAERLADFTAFFYLGDLIEFGESRKLFSSPSEERTKEYLLGAFG
ncbi:MAG: phosphate ABC transporter ATP-binding protein PstB [Spirochaetota bacterium]